MNQKTFDLKLKLVCEPHIQRYYEGIMQKATGEIAIAQAARAKGFDVVRDIETTPALDLADRTEHIIGPKGIAKRYREEFEKTNDRVKTIFTIFQEIIENSQEWYQEPNPEKRLDQGIRTSLVLLTEGAVVAPLDGVPKIKISQNPDSTKYVDIYFAGPIRAAGGTATVFPLILGDFARKLLELDRYKPTEDEIERYVEETGIYDEIVSRQYKLKPEEVRKIISNCPVCINGEPTEDREVSVHRDLERIPTNKIRGGACLVISEGIALKAMKIIQFAKQLNLDWNWLEGIIKMEKKGSDASLVIKPNTKYLERMAAGRPVFCYPMRFGGFRLRYGKSRNNGAMGKSIHPATMRALDDFVAVGTQIKVERPGKAASITPCDSIEGPIVRLYNGNVVQLNSSEHALQLKPQIEKILFLGDLLVPVGDFRKSGHPLMPVGYCEEWWKVELKKAIEEGKKSSVPLQPFLQNPKEISIQTALQLSKEMGVPLHPKFLFYYSGLEKETMAALMQALETGKQMVLPEGIGLELKNSAETKLALESIGCPHEMINQNQGIKINSENGLALLKTFGLLDNRKVSFEEFEKEKRLEQLSHASGLIIRDKGGTFVGSRMGRPEAARPRKMIGNPHTLFPIGLFGGATRSINKAAAANEKNAFSSNEIEVEIALFKCPECQKTLEFPHCSQCRTRTQPLFFCKHCKAINYNENCFKCGSKTQRHNTRKINLSEIMEQASKNLGVKMPELVKGVKGVINETKVVEPIEKGILRAQKDLHVFRDATIRYEMLNCMLTHFKPREIGTTVERLHELGYEKDMDGKPLENGEQVLELLPQDVIINDESGDYFVKITQFIDEELSRFYGLPEHYKISKKEQFIGQLVLGLAPHTSAAIVGRVIGYSKAHVGFAHPFFHLAKRRNCLVGKTPVLIQNGRKTKSVNIEDLDKTDSEGEIPLENVFTHTIDQNGDLKTRKVKALLKQKAPEKIYCIKTAYGRKIELTGDHRLLTLENNRIKTKKVSDLQENEPLLSLAKLSVEKELSEINALQWYLENSTQKEKQKLRIHHVKERIRKWIIESGGCWKLAKRINYRSGKAIHTAIDFDAVPLDLFEKILREMKKAPKDFTDAWVSYNKQKSRVPAALPLNRELGELVGYFLADGYARTTKTKSSEKFVYQINLVSDEKEITRRMKNHAERLFGRAMTTEKRNGVDYLTLSGRVYFDLFTRILQTGTKAHNKRVPTIFLNANTECVKGAVAGYIVGDGYIDSNSIRTTSVNKPLTNDFCLLFNRLECFPHLHSENRFINSGYVKEFYEKKGKKIRIQSHGIRLYSQDLLKIGPMLFGKKR